MKITKTRILDAERYDAEPIEVITQQIAEQASALLLPFELATTLDDPIFLNGMMEQMAEVQAAHSDAGAIFKAIDIVSYEVELPEAMDCSGFGEYAAFFEAHKGKTLSLPMHEVSVFEMGGREVAGPLFSSHLPDILRKPSPNEEEVNAKVGQLLDEMLTQHVYEGLIAGMPYFMRWVE